VRSVSQGVSSDAGNSAGALSGPRWPNLGTAGRVPVASAGPEVASGTFPCVILTRSSHIETAKSQRFSSSFIPPT
jgi:hypothetical protein